MRARYGTAQLRRLASWNSSHVTSLSETGRWQRLAPLRKHATTPKVTVASFRPFSTLTENDSGTTSYSRGNEETVEEVLPVQEGQGSAEATATTKTNPRLYMDPNFPLDYRIYKFRKQPLGTIDPLDMVLTAKDLMRESCARKSFEGMEEARDILDRVLEEKRHFNQLRTPDGKPQPYAIVIPEQLFEVLMYGWAKQCRKVPMAMTRMREVLDLMMREAEYDQGLRTKREKEGIFIPDNESLHGRKHSELDGGEMFATMSCQPSVGIYNTLLHGLSQAAYRSIGSANEAEDTLKNMERLASRRGWHTKPNTKSFMYVLTAFARTNHPTAGERAENVLRKMMRYHQEQIGLYRDKIGREYDLLNVENNVRRVVAPDTRAFTAVIQAHGESGVPGSSEKALRLLTEVLQSTDPNLIPDAHIFSATINAFAKQAAKMKAPMARLEAAKAADDILRLMVDLLLSSQGTQDKSLLRNPIPFNVCMNAWANANLKESPIRADEILKMMLNPEFHAKTGIQATTASFNACLHAWSRAAQFDPQAPQLAEDLLQSMEQIDYVHADVTSYTTIISAYAKSKRPDKISQARRVLEALLTNLPSRGQISAIPFTAALNAILSSPIEQPSTDRTSRGDLFGVNNDGVAASDVVDAYSIAIKIHDEVCSDVYNLGVTPDHLFFATIIDVIAKYNGHDSIIRRQRLEQVFLEACSSGEVSVKVVEALSRACSSQETFQTMLGLQRWPIETINGLPREWTHKVPPGFRKFKFNPSGKSRQGAQGSRPPSVA